MYRAERLLSDTVTKPFPRGRICEACAFWEMAWFKIKFSGYMNILSSRLLSLRITSLAIAAGTALTACAPLGTTEVTRNYHPPKETVALTAAQQCALGYDMARQVYNLIEVNKTVISVSPKLGKCSKYAIKYLRKAGYAVDESAKRATPSMFSISTYEDKEQEKVFATAYLPSIRLTRVYQRGKGGMYPVSSFNLVHTETAH